MQCPPSTLVNGSRSSRRRIIPAPSGFHPLRSRALALSRPAHVGSINPRTVVLPISRDTRSARKKKRNSTNARLTRARQRLARNVVTAAFSDIGSGVRRSCVERRKENKRQREREREIKKGREKKRHLSGHRNGKYLLIYEPSVQPVTTWNVRHSVNATPMAIVLHT